MIYKLATGLFNIGTRYLRCVSISKSEDFVNFNYLSYGHSGSYIL